MSARDELAGRTSESDQLTLVSHPALTWALDAIDRLREQNAAWMNGVADIVEPLGFDRHAASGPADLLPGIAFMAAEIEQLRSLAIAAWAWKRTKYAMHGNTAEASRRHHDAVQFAERNLNEKIDAVVTEQQAGSSS